MVRCGTAVETVSIIKFVGAKAFEVLNIVHDWYDQHVLVMFVDIHEDMGSAKGQIGKSYLFVLKQKLRVSG